MVDPARPAPRRDVDDVETGKRRDHRHGDADADFLAQAGNGDVDEFVPARRAVELGRFVEGRVDLGDAGHQQHGAEAQQHPGADDADGRQREVEIAEPAARPRPEADRRQQLVDDAVAGQHPAPGDAGRNERDDLRNEQDGAGSGAERSAQMRANDLRDAEPDADRDDGEIEHQLEGVADGHQQVGLGQHREVVLEAAKLRHADAVPAQQRIVRRHADGDQHEGRIEQQRRRDEQPGNEQCRDPGGRAGVAVYAGTDGIDVSVIRPRGSRS